MAESTPTTEPEREAPEGRSYEAISGFVAEHTPERYRRTYEGTSSAVAEHTPERYRLAYEGALRSVAEHTPDQYREGEADSAELLLPPEE
jgi:hypothetical protein